MHDGRRHSQKALPVQSPKLYNDAVGMCGGLMVLRGLPSTVHASALTQVLVPENSGISTQTQNDGRRMQLAQRRARQGQESRPMSEAMRPLTAWLRSTALEFMCGPCRAQPPVSWLCILGVSAPTKRFFKAKESAPGSCVSK